MGQAKQRGTFEQRRAESIQAEAERVELQRIELQARNEAQRLHDLAHPKQAAERRTRQRNFGMFLSVACGLVLSAPLHRPVDKNEFDFKEPE